MIKINLLTQDMAPGAGGGSTQGTGTALVTAVLAVLFLVNAVLGIGMYVYLNSARSEQEAVRAEASTLRAELEEQQILYDERQIDIERMEELIDVAQALDPPNRLLWSRKLNMLPLIVPEGVFLTEIRVTQRVTESETQASIERRRSWEAQRGRRGAPQQPPPIERSPVYQQTLVMDGVAYVPGGVATQRVEQILLFADNIRFRRVTLPFDSEETAERFIDGFSPNVVPADVSATEIEGREVSVFSFSMQSLPMRIE